MNKKNESIYTAIRIEGGLLSTSLLDTLRHYGLPGQGPADYGVEKGLKLADELGRYWRIAQARWEQFTDLRARSDVDRSEITIDAWLMPLFSRVLGFEIEKSLRPASIGERVFPITHMAYDGVVPLVLTSDNQSLDKGDHHFGQEGRKRSPMGLAQEYLNAEDKCLWAMASNGLTLRLLRDNPAMTRPAYVEVDFERIFNEELFVDFTVFWLLLHATRFETQDQTPESCYLEQWREQGQTDGERVLGQLRYGVADALRLLGTGFVSHPDNKALREAIQSGALNTDQFFQELLRLIYRILFLLTTEDRDILLDPDAAPATKNLYREGYSISNLRDRARLRRYWDGYEDAWNQLLITFEGFARGQHRLGQPALGGLFAVDQCQMLDQAQLANRYLFNAMFKLCYFEANRVLVRINYRDMDTEELGSVYESLLELIPQLNVQGQWRFGFIGDEEGEGSDSGHARKLTGSYYTPDALVQELIQSALEPVVRQRLEESPSNPREALLAIRVCDPACGSGHFLLAAARRMAAELARIEAGADQPTEDDYRHALREVVRHCIYGVDMNPLAVELCRTALWLEAIEPGKPLGFLDAHVQVGNSLIGIIDPSLMQSGIPNNAYKALVSDDKEVAKSLKKRNKVNPNQQELFGCHQTRLDVCAGNMDSMPEESLEQIERKRNAWHELMQSAVCESERLRADLLVAAYFSPKVKGNIELVPTNIELSALDRGDSIPLLMRAHIAELSRKFRFFHWLLAFPEVYERGGFDVLIGNPPWDISQFKDDEFFSNRKPSLVGLDSAKRDEILSNMETKHPKLFSEYIAEKDKSNRRNHFYKESGRFPLTGVGRSNLYSLFAETSAQLRSSNGSIGLVLESGIATADSSKMFFGYILEKQLLNSLIDFENRKGIFPSVHKSYKFCLLTLRNDSELAKLILFCESVSDISDKGRQITLRPSDIIALNPNTRNLPIFRTQSDADLTAEIYRKFPILNRIEIKEGNPWKIDIKRIFNMGIPAVAKLCSTNQEQTSARMYESKMMHQYDVTWATYDGDTITDVPLITRQAAYSISPRYFIDRKHLVGEMSRRNWSRNWLLAWRDICRSNDERTFIAAILPLEATDFTLRIGFIDQSPELICCFLANANSLVLDYVARQKLGGTHLSDYITNQLPFLPPESYSEINVSFITKRVLELSYTTNDLKPFAEDLGYIREPFPFEPEHRHQLKCELDAYYAKLYGLNREELRYILDPADVMGEYYPSETFRVLKNREINEFGEYRTRRLVLEAWDKLENGELIAQPSTTRMITKPATVVDLSTLPANALARPMQDPRAELGAQLAAILKVMTEAMPARQVRLAALLAFEPRLLLPYLSEAEAATWRRLIGDEAAPLSQGASAFIARTDQAWGAAVRYLRTNGQLIEDAQAGTWAQGTGLDGIVTEGWPDGRARMVADVLKRHDTDTILTALPSELRGWVDAAA